MIKIKHLLDDVEDDDGQRIWIEPIGLTLDLRQWCQVDFILCHLGPTRALWKWYEQRPEGYEFFRAKYHELLAQGPYRKELLDLVSAARHENVTLLHQGDDAENNSAMALYEFLCELDAYVPPEI